MPELQHMGLAVELPHWGNLGAVKLAAAIGFGCKGLQLFAGEAIQEQTHNAAARC